MNKFMLKDSGGKKSITMTAFCLGFIVVNAKLLLAGMTIGSYQMATFSGTEYGAAIAALGAIYVLRRNNDEKKES